VSGIIPHRRLSHNSNSKINIDIIQVALLTSAESLRTVSDYVTRDMWHVEVFDDRTSVLANTSFLLIESHLHTELGELNDFGGPVYLTWSAFVCTSADLNPLPDRAYNIFFQ